MGGTRVSFRDHLEESGLTTNDAKKLKYTDLTGGKVYDLVGQSAPGFMIPYFNAQGKVLKDVYRIRFYHPVNLNQFKRGRPKLRKYTQPANVRPHAYFPPLISWKSIVDDPSVPIFITEGEKKAAKACKEGYPTIGLGGVYNFMSKERNMEFLPELDEIKWQGRKVVIVYDSDLATNKDVKQARRVLTSRFYARGATVYYLNFQVDRDEKVGFDDYLVQYGKEAFDVLVNEAECVTPDDSKLSEYLERYALIVSVAGVWDIEKKRLQSMHKFLVSHPHDHTVGMDKSGRQVRITYAEAWRDSPKKIEADSIVCDPSEYDPRNPVLTPLTSDGNINVFKGLGLTPKRGSIKPWRTLLEIVFKGRKDYIRWFEKWLAYPLQNLGTKLNQSVFVYGGQGLGKSAIGYIMRDIYGPSSELAQDHTLFNTFNKWMEGCLFAMGDELMGDYPRKSRAHLKTLITSETIPVEPKGVDSYEVDNMLNFYLTANEPRALPLDAFGSNRRFFVIHCPEIHHPKYPRLWYRTEFNDWRGKKTGSEGPRALLYHLLNLDTSGFDPFEDAPDTPEKTNVVSSSRSNVETWVSRLKENTTAFPNDLYEAHALYKIYSSETGDHRTGIGTFTNALSQIAYACNQVYLGQNAVDSRKFISLWAIRNFDKYAHKKDVVIAKAYKQQFANYKTKGKKK
jgi:hypothetical protein